MPLDIVLHTPGGLVLAALQIAHAIRAHKAKVTVFVPHYAMSGGTLIALAADEIVMCEHSVLGPIDPQIGQLAAESLKPWTHLPHQAACAGAGGLSEAREQTGDNLIGKELKYQLRLTLSDPFAKGARDHPDDPSIAPLTQVLQRHEAALKCQYDAFADYVREAEAEGVERYPLYAWTKKRFG